MHYNISAEHRGAFIIGCLIIPMSLVIKFTDTFEVMYSKWNITIANKLDLPSEPWTWWINSAWVWFHRFFERHGLNDAHSHGPGKMTENNVTLGHGADGIFWRNITVKPRFNSRQKIVYSPFKTDSLYSNFQIRLAAINTKRLVTFLACAGLLCYSGGVSVFS